MDLNDAMSPFGWAVIIGSLAVAAVFSVLAYHRPRPPYLYVAGGAVIVALVAASTTQADAPPAAAPLMALLGMTVAVFGGSPAAATALQLAMGGSAAPGAHGCRPG